MKNEHLDANPGRPTAASVGRSAGAPAAYVTEHPTVGDFPNLPVRRPMQSPAEPRLGKPTVMGEPVLQARAGPFFYGVLVGLLALVGVAAYAWYLQLREGLTVTGLNEYVTWGLYIVNFVFLIGASAGGIIVAGLANLLNLERYRTVARIAEILAFVCLSLAGLSILMSMGRPDRTWELFAYGHPGSPLIWDVFVIFTYMALTLALLYFATRADLVHGMRMRPRLAWLYRLLAFGRTSLAPDALARDRRWLRVLSAIAIPYAIVLHSVTAWILGLVKARPAWFSTLLAPLFVASALVSGLALVLAIAIVARWTLKARVSDNAIQGLAKILLYLIPLLGYFLFAELLTVMFGGVPEETVFFEDMIWGQYAWVFWFDLIGGLVVPFAILVFPRLRANRPAVFLAAILVFLGVYAERFNLVVVPQFHKWLPHIHGTYTPTWVELGLTVGVAALVGVAIMVLSRLVPLAEPEANPSAAPKP